MSANEYARFRIKYAIARNKNSWPSSAPPAIEIESSTTNAVRAASMDSLPLAMGRFFFFGCSRSASTSTRSLSTYTELESTQNTANAPKP